MSGDLELRQHVVRDGPRRRLEFSGRTIGSSTSYRIGAQRWSELAVYALPDGSYILSKVGRSIVAHRPECPRVSWKMVSWLEAGEEGRVRRSPCVECRPVIGDDMDPHTMLEATRYSARSAPDAEALLAMLLLSPDGEEERTFDDAPWLIRKLIASAVANDPLGLGSLGLLLGLRSGM